jgi:hypothetical protein
MRVLLHVFEPTRIFKEQHPSREVTCKQYNAKFMKNIVISYDHQIIIVRINVVHNRL